MSAEEDPYLIGVLGLDSRTGMVVVVHQGDGPAALLEHLREVWTHSCGGDSSVLAAQLVADGDWWQLEAAPGGAAVHGLGIPMETGHKPTMIRLADPALTVAGWLYLVDVRTDTVLVYEATIHHTWRHAGTYELRAAPATATARAATLFGDTRAPRCSPHRWQTAYLSVDGSSATYPGEICAGEHARGTTVVRLHRDHLDTLMTDIARLYTPRRPGSTLPHLSWAGTKLVVRWLPDTAHTQTQIVTPDRHGRYELGPQVLPWTLPAETPAHPADTLTNLAQPRLEWLTPEAFASYHPTLCGYSLPLITLALAYLNPGRPTVISPGIDRIDHQVTLPAGTHALLVRPSTVSRTLDTVVLPRPLGGSWTADPSVPVVTPDKAVDACTAIWRRASR